MDTASAEAKGVSAVVCDASVLFKLLVPEEDSAKARSLASSYQLIAPEIIFAEIGNVLCTQIRSHGLSLEIGQTLLTRLDSFGLETHPVQPLLARALNIGHQLNHAIYDCLYLALAERLNLALVSADRRFISAVRRSRLRTAQVRMLGERA